LRLIQRFAVLGGWQQHAVRLLQALWTADGSICIWLCFPAKKSSYNLWQCKCYCHKHRDLRKINRDMHRMFAFTDLCIIWSYWWIIIANEYFALINKSAYINKYLLFNQFITKQHQCNVWCIKHQFQPKTASAITIYCAQNVVIWHKSIYALSIHYGVTIFKNNYIVSYHFDWCAMCSERRMSHKTVTL